MRGGVGIAHQETPRRSELRIDVRIRGDAVFDEARAKRIDPVAPLRIVGTFGRSGNESRVVDQELHTGETLGDATQVECSYDSCPNGSPLWTAIVRMPSLRAFSMNARPVSSSR